MKVGKEMKLFVSLLAIAMLAGLPACQKKSSSRKSDGSANDQKKATNPTPRPATTPVPTQAAFSAEASCDADIKFGGGPTTMQINTSQGMISIFPSNNPSDVTQYRISQSSDKKWWAPKSIKYTVQPSTNINNNNQQNNTATGDGGYLVFETQDRDKFGDKYRNVFACGFQYKGKKFVCTYPLLTKFNCR